MRLASTAVRPLRRFVADVQSGQSVRASMLRGASLTMAIRATGAGLAFGSQVLLARFLGELEYGIFLFAWSCALLLALPASLGLNQAALRFVPQYRARGAWDLLAGVIGRFRRLVLLGGCAGALLGIAGVRVLAPWIEDYYVAPLSVALAALPVFALLNLYAELSRGFDRLALAFAPRMVLAPVLLLTGVGVLWLWDGPATGSAVLAVVGAASVATLVVQGSVFHRGVPEACLRAAPVHRTREWLTVALPLLFREGFIVLLTYTDILMLGALAGPEEVAVYGAASRCAAPMYFLFFATAAPTVPRFAALYHEGRRQDLAALVQSVVRWTFFPSLLAGSVLLVVGKPLLGLFGSAFAAGYPVLIILVGQSLLIAMSGNAVSLLEMTGHQKASAAVYATGTVLNVTLNALLIPRYGIVGAAAASLLSACLVTGSAVALARARLGILVLLQPAPRNDAP